MARVRGAVSQRDRRAVTEPLEHTAVGVDLEDPVLQDEVRRFLRLIARATWLNPILHLQTRRVRAAEAHRAHHHGCVSECLYVYKAESLNPGDVYPNPLIQH